MFAPDSEDTDEEGEGRHYHLPGLGGAELPVAPEDFPHTAGQHPRALTGQSSTSETHTTRSDSLGCRGGNGIKIAT